MVTHLPPAAAPVTVSGVTIEQTQLLSREDLTAELATARRGVSTILHEIDTFAELAHDEPWRHLDDLLNDLRSAATTVAVLERIQGRTG